MLCGYRGGSVKQLYQWLPESGLPCSARGRDSVSTHREENNWARRDDSFNKTVNCGYFSFYHVSYSALSAYSVEDFVALGNTVISEYVGNASEIVAD